MKKIPKEKRVVNLDKSKYDIIKEYCNNNSLKMSNWISDTIVDLINHKKIHLSSEQCIVYLCEIMDKFEDSTMDSKLDRKELAAKKLESITQICNIFRPQSTIECNLFINKIAAGVNKLTDKQIL